MTSAPAAEPMVVQGRPIYFLLALGLVLVVSPAVDVLAPVHEWLRGLDFFAERRDWSALGLDPAHWTVLAVGGLLLLAGGFRRRFRFDPSTREVTRDYLLHWLPCWRSTIPFGDIRRVELAYNIVRTSTSWKPGLSGRHRQRREVHLVLRRDFRILVDHGADSDRLSAMAGDIAKVTGARLV